MGLLNPGFETAGAQPWLANGWTLSAVTSLEEIAGFGVPEEAWEGFERWHTLRASLADVTAVLAFFGSALVGHEQFEAGWANTVYLRELPPAQLVTGSFGGRPVEDCESDWSNAPYAREWAAVSASAGVFAGVPVEPFEQRWRGNEAYVRTWAAVVSSAATFDAGAQAVEDFENAWTHAATL